MVRTLSLTTLQIDALTSENDTILYNAQQRDVTLYGGTGLASNITQLEIDNPNGNCLTLRHDSDINNYTNFTLNNTGILNVNVNNGNKSFNIVNHNGENSGLMLNGTLVIATAYELNQLSGLTAPLVAINLLDSTPGTATAGKALITDSNNNISGINDLSTNNLTVNGTLVTASATELNYTDIATAGTAQAAKALVVDVNRNISNINNLSAVNLTGTLQTASQTNITSVGNLTNLTLANNGNVTMSGTGSISGAASVSATNLTGTLQTASQPNITDVGTINGLTIANDENIIMSGTGSISGAASVSATDLTGTLQTASQPNITSVGTLNGLTIATNENITGASNVSASTLTGTLTTAAQTNITSVGTLSGLTTSGNLDITSHNGTNTGLKLNGTLVTAQASDLNKLPNITATPTQLNYLSGVTPGVITASHALVVDGNKDLNGLRNLITTGSITGAIEVSATTLTGTLGTASQPNITSVGTLNDLTITNGVTSDSITTNSFVLDGNDISSSLGNIGKLDNVTPGTVTASKVLIVDSNKHLTGMGNLTSTGTVTANTLTGTISTASQPNITFVGNLSGLTIANNENITMSGNGFLSGAASVSATNLTGTLQTASQPNITSIGNLTNLTLANNGNVTMSGTGFISGAASVSATNLTGTLQTASQLNVTEVGTLNGLDVNNNLDVSSHNGTTTGLKLAGALVTASADNLNTLAGVTAGTVSASKAVVLDSFKNLTGINNLTTTGTISGVTTLTATTVAGTLSTASQPNITTLAGVTSIGASGSTTITGTLQTAVQPNVTTLAGVTSVGASSSTTITGTLQTAVQPNITTLAGVTSIGASDSTTVKGVLQTTAQPNITSVGTLSTLSLSGAISGVTTLTATTLAGTLSTASQPNITTLAGVTTIGASGLTTVTGTLQTAAQPNITSVGTLSSLTLGGALSGVTSFNSSGILTNTSNIASTNNSTGALILSGGVSISNTTDAVSSTNGGTFTSAGGGSFAKSLYIGTNLSVGSTMTVGSNLTVGGNLIVTGTTTSINSTSTTILDNTLLLNSGPSGSGYDAGILAQRYQIENASGSGDVVSDEVKETYTISSGTESTIVLPSGANTNDNYYNNWWIKIISGGALDNQVRKISNYVGSTKTATLNTALTISPTSSDTINLYNKGFTSLFWNESNKRFTTAFTSNDINSNTLNIIDYADFASNNIIGLSNTSSTSYSTGALRLAGGIGISNTTDAISSTNGGTFTSAGGGSFAKSLYVGTTLTATTLAGTLSTASQPNITSVGTLTSLTMSGAISGITTLTATTLAGTLSTASQPNITTLAGVTSIGASSATAITGLLQTAAQNNITSVGTLTGLNVSSTSTNSIKFNGSTPNALVLPLQIEHIIAGGGSIGLGSGIAFNGSIASGSVYSMGRVFGQYTNVSSTWAGRIILSSVFNSSYVDSVTISSSGATTSTLTVNGTGTLSATNLAGTLQTAAQPNVTSVGILSGLTVSSSTYNSLAITDIFASSIATPLQISHLVSGAGAVGIGSAINFSSTIASGTTTTASRIYGQFTDVSSSWAGKLVLANVYNATFVDAVTISSSGATTSSLTVNGTGTITATNLVGTLSTAAQPNITSVGTLTSLTMSGAISGVTTLTATTLAGTLSTASQPNITTLAGVTAIGASSSTTLTGTLQTASQPNITLVGTLTSLTMSGAISGVTTLTATTLAGTLSTALQPNITTLAGVTAIGASSSTTLTGTLQTAAQPNVTSVGTLIGLTMSGSISGVTTLTATTLAGTLSTASQPNITTLAGVTAIGASGSTTLTGTLQTAAQPNITSVGTLTGLTMSGSISGVTTLTATTLAGTLSTASQPNITTLAGVTNIGASGSTAITGTLQTVSQPNITTLTGVTTIGASATTAITGRLQTAAQPNITSVGTLTGLTMSGALNVTSANTNLGGVLTVGNSSTENKICFFGVTGDANANHTVIAERLYNNTTNDLSELILFKGNDFSGLAGPDRIRLRSAEIRFQTFSTGEDYSGLADNNNRMVILENGNVGIGTTTPSSILTVSGSTSITGNITITGNSTISGTSAITGTLLLGNSTDNAPSRSISALNSNLTAGNTGTYICIGRGATYNNQAEISFKYAGDTSGNNSLNFGFYTGVNSGQAMILTAAGNLSVYGTVTASGSLLTSDYRIKENIINLNYGLNDINKLRPVVYNLIDNTEKQLGFIAHELQEIIPELVHGTKDEVDEEGKMKIQSVCYSNLTAVLVKGIQEQSSIIETLQAKNADLEERLSNLEAFIASLQK